jgi:hypothetical protein
MSSTLPLQPLAFDLVLPWHADRDREKAFYGTLKKVLVPIMLGLFFVQSFEFAHSPIESEDAKTFEEKIIPQAPKPMATTSTKAKSPKAALQLQVNATETLETDVKTAFVKSQELSEVSSQLTSLRNALDLSKMQNNQVSDNAGGIIAIGDREILSKENLSRKARNLVVDEALMKGDAVNLEAPASTSITVSTSTDDVPQANEGEASVDNNISLLSGNAEERSLESIRAALESVKSHAYTVYQRALIDNPELSGKSIFSIVIEPNGSISELKVVANELQLPELEREILAQIKHINFGSSETGKTMLEYKFVFFPS